MASPREAILLITGITGYGTDSGELIQVVNNLKREDPDRPVFVWHHPRFSKASESAELPSTMSDLTDLIIQEFLKTPGSKAPKISVYGYSFGGVLVPEIAKKLQDQDKHVSAGIIDTPHPNVLKEDLVSGNIKATERLIRIMQHASKIAGFPCMKQFSSADIQTISAKAIEEQLQDIWWSIVKPQMRSHAEKAGAFGVIEQVVSNHLKLLSNYTMDPLLKLDQLTVMTTEETRDYYKCGETGGWNDVAKKIVTKQLKGTHASTISLDNANEIAKIIAPALSSTAKSHIRLIPPVHRQMRPSSPSLSSQASSDTSDDEDNNVAMVSSSPKNPAPLFLGPNTRNRSRHNNPLKQRKNSEYEENTSDSDIEMKEDRPATRRRMKGLARAS